MYNKTNSLEVNYSGALEFNAYNDDRLVNTIIVDVSTENAKRIMSLITWTAYTGKHDSADIAGYNITVSVDRGEEYEFPLSSLSIKVTTTDGALIGEESYNSYYCSSRTCNQCVAAGITVLRLLMHEVTAGQFDVCYDDGLCICRQFKVCDMRRELTLRLDREHAATLLRRALSDCLEYKVAYFSWDNYIMCMYIDREHIGISVSKRSGGLYTNITTKAYSSICLPNPGRDTYTDWVEVAAKSMSV